MPLLPTAMTFSRRPMYSQRASSITSALFTEGMAGKSKVSRLLGNGRRGCAAPPCPDSAFQPLPPGVDYEKTQLLADTFQFSKRGLKKKQKEAARAERSKKPKTPKDPKPKRVPLTPEARKERQQVRFKERLEEAKALGLCRHYHNPPVKAIEGQTRCQQCAERHRVRRREDDSKRGAAAKLSEEKPTQGPVAPASPEATAPQPDQQAEYRNARAVCEVSTPTHRAEAERPKGTSPQRQKTWRESQKKRREEAKELGLCRDCREPAIPDQTRCETCAEKHRVGRRQYDAARRKENGTAGHQGGGTR